MLLVLAPLSQNNGTGPVTLSPPETPGFPGKHPSSAQQRVQEPLSSCLALIETDSTLPTRLRPLTAYNSLLTHRLNSRLLLENGVVEAWVNRTGPYVSK
jgi:hypothetical protein